VRLRNCRHNLLLLRSNGRSKASPVNVEITKKRNVSYASALQLFASSKLK
jgi:hypothetical protein